jgi:hypothetical protein
VVSILKQNTWEAQKSWKRFMESILAGSPTAH